MAQEFIEKLWDLNQGPDHVAAICAVCAGDVDKMVASMEPYSLNQPEKLKAGVVLLYCRGCPGPEWGQMVQGFSGELWGINQLDLHILACGSSQHSKPISKFVDKR